MKPTRNKVYCLSCRRQKMIFESQSKADNFIRYNQEEIEEENGRAPVRSYYCKLCAGWHVTSKASKAVKVLSDRRDERLLEEVDEYAKSNEEIHPYLTKADEQLSEAELMIVQGRIDEAEQLLSRIAVVSQLTECILLECC